MGIELSIFKCRIPHVRRELGKFANWAGLTIQSSSFVFRDFCRGGNYLACFAHVDHFFCGQVRDKDSVRRNKPIAFWFRRFHLCADLPSGGLTLNYHNEADYDRSEAESDDGDYSKQMLPLLRTKFT